SSNAQVCWPGDRNHRVRRPHTSNSGYVGVHAGPPRRARDSRCDARRTGAKTFAIAHRQHRQGRLHGPQPARLRWPRNRRRRNPRGSAWHPVPLDRGQRRKDQELSGGRAFHLECQPARSQRRSRTLRSLVAAHSASATRGAVGSLTHRSLLRSLHGLRLPHLRSVGPPDRQSEGAVKKVLIAGVGNVLLGDDGVGPYVARLLAAHYEFADGVEVADLGTPALDLIDHFSANDAVILIDSVNTDAASGTVMLYRKPDIMRLNPAVRMDPHSPALVDALLSAELFGVAPADVLLVGIQLGSCEVGCSLSEPVKASLERAIAEALNELDHLRVGYRWREHPAENDIWWDHLGVEHDNAEREAQSPT